MPLDLQGMLPLYIIHLLRDRSRWIFLSIGGNRIAILLPHKPSTSKDRTGFGTVNIIIYTPAFLSRNRKPESKISILARPFLRWKKEWTEGSLSVIHSFPESVYRACWDSIQRGLWGENIRWLYADEIWNHANLHLTNEDITLRVFVTLFIFHRRLICQHSALSSKIMKIESFFDLAALR